MLGIIKENTVVLIFTNLKGSNVLGPKINAKGRVVSMIIKRRPGGF